MAIEARAGVEPKARAAADALDRRRLDVQGLRAVAVLLVVGYHAGLPIPGGFVGVDVFFVISGFVITGMLQREWQTHGRIRLGRFYVRRFKRLTPALALMVAVTLLMSTLLLSPLGPQQTTAQTAIGAMFLVANAVIARTTGDYFDGPAEQNALLHTWSLSVEEQFYLGFPILLVGCWLLARRAGWSPRRVAAAVVGAAVAFSFAVAVLVSRGLELQAGEMLVGFYGPLTRVWEFGAGALLAIVPGWAVASRRLSGLAQGAGGVALLVASVLLISEETVFPGPWTLLPVIGTVLLIRAGGRADSRVGPVLGARPMVSLGDWSYSIYLWHWPFIVFAGAMWPNSRAALVLAAVLSIGPAIASYRWVEEPIRVMELRPTWLGRLAAACLAAPVLLALLLGAAVSQAFWSDTIRAHQDAVLEDHAGCYDVGPLTSSTVADCTFNEQATGAPVYLVGDSHAQHFTAAAVDAGAALGRPVVVSTATNCPVLDMELRFTAARPGHDIECAAFSQGTRSFLAEAQAGTVLLAMSDRYWSDDRFEVGSSAEPLTAISAKKLGLAASSTTATVRALQAAGHEVIVVDDVPAWQGTDEWSPIDCPAASLLTGIGGCDRRMPAERAQERQGDTRAMLRSVAESTGVRVLDLWPSLCPAGECSTVRDGQTMYRDADHISVPQSRALAPAFRLALAG